MSVFHHDTRLVVELSQATSYETDDPMIEIRSIKKQYWPSGIDTRQSSLVLRLGGSFPRLVEMLEFSEKLISSPFSCEEPTQCSERCIHATCCIDSRANLESYDISIALDLLSSFEEFPESH